MNQASTTNDSSGNQPKSANELAEERTDLALERTLMAADRSLMAWVRTALSMLSFGFTIYKLLDAFQQKGGDLTRAQSPRAMGLFLTGLGTVAMVMGVLEYWYCLKGLRQLGRFRVVRPTLVMAAIMTFAGLFIFIGMVSKLV